MPDPISSLSQLQGTMSRVQGALANAGQSNDPQAGLNNLQGALGNSLPNGLGNNLENTFNNLQSGLTKQAVSAVAEDPLKGNRTLTENDTLHLEGAGFQALTGGAVAPAFGEVMGGFLNNVNAAQQKSDALSEALAVGDEVDIHQTMLALTDATNAMSMTLQVRSHVLKAYQDLMSIPL